MLPGFSLGSYLLLVDYTSHLCRNGKARLTHHVASIFERLGTSAEVWSARIQQLQSKTRLLGSFFTTDHQRLRQIAQQQDRHHLDNIVSRLV